jgi:hypothetical protein
MVSCLLYSAAVRDSSFTRHYQPGRYADYISRLVVLLALSKRVRIHGLFGTGSSEAHEWVLVVSDLYWPDLVAIHSVSRKAVVTGARSYFFMITHRAEARM